MNKLYWILILLLCTTPEALEAVRGKVEIRENKRRAQLSVLLQVIQPVDLSPKAKRKAILGLVRESLKAGIQRQEELEHHQRFTHVFVSLFKANAEEDVVAVFSKTPHQKRPTLNIFESGEPMLSQIPPSTQN